jgi:hypothetical protein
MPVNIRNIMIVAHITDDNQKKVTGVNGTASTEGNKNINDDTRMQIVEEAVQQVLEILERQKDR